MSNPDEEQAKDLQTNYWNQWLALLSAVTNRLDKMQIPY